MKTYKEFLEKANTSIDEGWRPPNLPRLVSRLGSLESAINTSSRNSPEYARYRRVADVTSQSRNNPNTPFKKPSGDNFLNSVWNKFSSRIKTQSPSNPAQKPSSTKTTLPSSNSRFRGGTGGSLFRDRMGDYSKALRTRGAASGGLIDIRPVDSSNDPMSSANIQGNARRRAEQQFKSRGGVQGV